MILKEFNEKYTYESDLIQKVGRIVMVISKEEL